MNLTDKIAAIDAARNELNRLIDELTPAIQAELGEQFTVCNETSATIQLWHNPRISTGSAAYKTLKDYVDDCEMTKSFEDENYVHYHFNIDRSPFCIVLTKEDLHE